jgi:hypothetical protein
LNFVMCDVLLSGLYKGKLPENDSFLVSVSMAVVTSCHVAHKPQGLGQVWRKGKRERP